MPSCRDLPALPAYLELLQDAGADAMIVADVGVIRMAQKYAPKVPLHISTQTSILNPEAANFWADMGAERVVLARELSLEEIAEIRAKTPKSLEIEAFVHGAMCISYSGRQGDCTVWRRPPTSSAGFFPSPDTRGTSMLHTDAIHRKGVWYGRFWHVPRCESI